MFLNYNHIKILTNLQENAALCERASETQQKLIIAQEERVCAKKTCSELKVILFHPCISQKFLWKKYNTTLGNNFTTAGK